MNEIESFLKNVMGDFDKKISPIKNSNNNTISYSKFLFSYPTIQMVLISPFTFHSYNNFYILEDDSVFLFFLYDLEIWKKLRGNI